MEKKRRKIVKAKVENSKWRGKCIKICEILLFKTTEICSEPTKMEISTRKKAFRVGKKLGTVTLLPPPDKYLSYLTE